MTIELMIWIAIAILGVMVFAMLVPAAKDHKHGNRELDDQEFLETYLSDLASGLSALPMAQKKALLLKWRRDLQWETSDE